MTKILTTYKLTREYLIEAKNQEEAEEIIRQAENDLNWLDNEYIEINKPLKINATRYFLVEYETRDGEHEYSEYAVTQANSLKQAERNAIKSKKLFDRYGWEEFCKMSLFDEISIKDYEVLKKYFIDV
jgi:hypothetical protein